MKIPRAKSSLVFREETDDWSILFDPDTGDTFGLDPISGFIWKRLDGSLSYAELLNEVREEFLNVHPDVEDDINNFIQSLQENNLIENLNTI